MRRQLAIIGEEIARAGTIERGDDIFFLNLQDVRGQAKPYQIRQFLRLVERYALRMVNDH